MRIGYGYDSHRFTDGDYVPIGGIKIPFNKGILAHSDGDVLLHAIGDALLGAAALGDLGRHFPESDPNYSEIPSLKLLEHIVKMLVQRHYRIMNVDATVITEAPRLQKYIPPMQKIIAEQLKVTQERVSVKASTNEQMGWIGHGEGLAAHAVVLICTFDSGPSAFAEGDE